MFRRQKTGSVVCASCGSLVGVNDDKCYSCGRRNPGLWGFGPMLRAFGNDLGFITLVIYGSSFLYVLGLLLTTMRGGNILGSGNILGMLAADQGVQLMMGASGAGPVFGLRRWWTVLSASWLHGGALHILFNMLWVRQLGPATADIYGPGRMIVLYTISGVVGFTVSSVGGLMTLYVPMLRFFGGAGYTVGASAPIFGLLGALVYYGRRGGSSLVRSEAMGYAITLFVMGFIMPGVDNYAHAGGFLGGYLGGLMLDPLKRESVDHLVLAALCLGLTALAILYSMVTLWPLVMG